MDLRKNRRILVVDDQADAREFFSFVLRTAGAEVTEAADGAAALRAALERPPDLVMTDLVMPLMDGVELSHCLSEHEATRNIPVVVVTGQAIGDVALRARSAGCKAVVAKPCSPDALVQAVNYQIGRRAADRIDATHADPVPFTCERRAAPHWS